MSENSWENVTFSAPTQDKCLTNEHIFHTHFVGWNLLFLNVLFYVKTKIVLLKGFFFVNLCVIKWLLFVNLGMLEWPESQYVHFKQYNILRLFDSLFWSC